MTNNDDIEVIRARFLDTFGDDIRVALDHETIDVAEGETYAHFMIVPGNETPKSIFNRTYEAKGRVYLYLYVPLGQPLRPARVKEAQFIQAFRDWVSDDDRIRFESPDYEQSANKVYNILSTSILYRAVH